jgi:7,8-dihydroneopterin aldolase/epimerase/oxygenase
MRFTVSRGERALLERDRIRLRGLEYYGYHGVMDEEKSLGQRFLIDVDLYKDLRQAGESDQVNDTINYAEVYLKIKAIVTEERYQLIEKLAQRIADQVLYKFSANAIRVEVHKPQAPIPGVFEDISVEIFRERRA